jgi:hypothetical protein
MLERKYKLKYDLVGKKFGRLLVTEKSNEKTNSGDQLWVCDCDCGTKNKLITTNHLISNHSTSCGCYRDEVKRTALRKYNEYDLSGNYGICYMRTGFFYFDLEKYDKIKDYYWSIHLNGYVATARSYKNKSRKTYLHRLLFDLTKGNKIVVDHIDHNVLDNRTCNIRLASHMENCRNTKLAKNNKSGIIGVFFVNKEKMWYAKIKVNYKDITLGKSKNIEDVIPLRLQAEKLYFGEFAPQKHLFEQYGIE